MKRKGGAGGSHIGVGATARARGNVYYQERVDGSAVSALFVANGEEARVLGFSEQWTAPSKRSPWRYGGAVRPARLAAAAKEAMVSAVEHVTSAFSIKGLASADFMVHGQSAMLLEINPRPGATLDIFDSAASPLLGLHLDAVTQGKLPQGELEPRRTRWPLPSFLRRKPSFRAFHHDLAPIGSADKPKPGRNYRQKSSDMHCVGPRGHQSPR